MERNRFVYAVSISVTLLLLSGYLDVYVPDAVRDPLKNTLQKTLAKMPCEDTAKVIEDKILSPTNRLTETFREDAITATAGTCEQQKSFVFSYISSQLPDASEDHVGEQVVVRPATDFLPNVCGFRLSRSRRVRQMLPQKTQDFLSQLPLRAYMLISGFHTRLQCL